MGVSEALYGWLTDRHRLKPGEPLDSGLLIQPRAEPEIAFITSRHLEGPVGLDDVLSATAAVAPALDILDSRFAGYAFALADVVADNCSAGAFVVGNPVPLDSFDLGLAGCVFEKNGEVVGTAAGAAVSGHPATALAWFVRKLAERWQGPPRRISGVARGTDRLGADRTGGLGGRLFRPYRIGRAVRSMSGPAEAGEALVAHPDVGAITFTGESATGKAIMATAAPSLKKLSFEVGGNSPNIVCANADPRTDRTCRARPCVRSRRGRGSG